MRMVYHVFISYSSKDKQIADKVCQVLESHNMKCWLAPRDIVAGQKYSEAIESAICNCSVFLIIFSKNSNSSPWVESELNIAFTECKKIVPLRIDNTKLEGEMRLLLNNKQWITISQSTDKSFDNLVVAITGYTKIQGSDNKQACRRDKLDNKSRNVRIVFSFFRRNTISIICILLSIVALFFYLFYSKSFYLGNEACITFTVDNVSFDMVFVKGGTFEMGEVKTEDNSFDIPKHQVTLSDFYIGKYEVTQDLWRAVMNDNPSEFRGENLPVNNISWYECQAFVRRLSNITNKKFVLPTEAQWEYAARGGVKSKGYNYSGSNNLNDVGWYNLNSDMTLHNVGIKKPNELGIYDMCGNSEEFCSDWYVDWYNVLYCKSEINPVGPDHGEDGMVVVRNGSWSSSNSGCRISVRSNFPSESGSAFIGFRLALIP